MKSRRAFYKKYVDKKIRITRAIFSLVCIVMFGIILYDSFVNNLPFYYPIKEVFIAKNFRGIKFCLYFRCNSFNNYWNLS